MIYDIGKKTENSNKTRSPFMLQLHVEIPNYIKKLRKEYQAYPS